MHDNTDTPSTLQKMEKLLAQLDQQVRDLREEVSQLRAAKPPRMPWKWWFRHKIKQFLGLENNIGKLVFSNPPRPMVVPKRYYRKPVLVNPPLISVVTPSFNQGHYLEQTLQSVLSQEYPRLEYVVQDGGSKDSTGEVIARYADRLSHWEMKKDKGHANAINLGFSHTTGEIMGFVNSDDLLLPGSLHAVAQYFMAHPEVDVVYGHRVVINSDGLETGRWVLPPHDYETMKYLDIVPQETMFWRRRVWEKFGGIDEAFWFAMDWEMLLRWQAAGAKFYRYPQFLGAFRVHQSSKTMTIMTSTGEKDAAILYRRYLGRELSPEEVQLGMRRYYYKHMIYNRLYQLGLFRY